jgi:hypothetical protein
MDPDKPARPHSLIRIHTVRLQALQIEKLIATSMDPDQTARMLIANALRWFCRGAARILFSLEKGRICDEISMKYQR